MIAKDSLAKSRETSDKHLRKATLCFLVKGNQVLLAMKKRGFAEGMWNGVGGKMDEKDESIRKAAIRETKEEIGVKLISLKKVATLNFYHHNNKNANQQVTVYIANKWEGTPKETEEMAPKWFKFNEIPYDEMWEDDKFWMPKIFNGEKLEADFFFDKKQHLLEQDIRKIA